MVLHESAHAWFNGSLLADRWANEAFASYYGLEVAGALKVKAAGEVLTPALEAARIPLNAWGPVGREDANDRVVRLRGLAGPRARHRRAGRRGRPARGVGRRVAPRRRVPATGARGRCHVGGRWRRGRARDGDAAPDWRGLLDLLEAHAATSFDDLWRTWVARDTDLALLDARAAARARYDEVVAAAGDWQLPRAVRDAMRAWQFDQATELLDQAADDPRPARRDRHGRRARPG